MKQKDIALLIVIVAVSGVASFFISHELFASSKSRRQSVEKVDAITTEFPTPDKKYFNSTSIDPTQQVPIGTTNNTNPFSGASQ